MVEHFELEVPSSLRRGAHTDEQRWIESAHQLLDLVTRSCGLATLDGLSVLDMGCGTKLTKALLERRVPIARYAGIDVDREVIEFLRNNVDDARFTFDHVDVQNALYNPDGLPLRDRAALPVGDERFDVIWLFSVFTHLAPGDYHAMLRLLRRHAAPDGWLIFSLYINELTGTGFGPVDRLTRPTPRDDRAQAQLARAIKRRIDAEGDEWLKEALRHRAATPPARYIDAERRPRDEGTPPDFVDLIPDKPLMKPLYSRTHALELIRGTGWTVESLNPPEPEYVQHYFVCRPG